MSKTKSKTKSVPVKVKRKPNTKKARPRTTSEVHPPAKTRKKPVAKDSLFDDWPHFDGKSKKHANRDLTARKPLWLKLAIISVVFAGLAFANGWWLSPRDELRQADVIVAISGGDTRGRTLLATDIYQAGWAERMIFSGDTAQADVISNAEAMRNIAVESGVPEQVIELSVNADNTVQNAAEVVALLEGQDIGRIILVTSQYHQRRASIDFDYELRSAGIENVEIINYPLNEESWSRTGWWTRPKGWLLTVGEDAKIVAQFFGRAISNR